MAVRPIRCAGNPADLWAAVRLAKACPQDDAGFDSSDRLSTWTVRTHGQIALSVLADASM